MRCIVFYKPVTHNAKGANRKNSWHAEEDAIRSAISRYGKKSVINANAYGVVVRHDRDGTLRISNPCKFCSKFSEKYNIKWLHS